MSNVKSKLINGIVVTADIIEYLHPKIKRAKIKRSISTIIGSPLYYIEFNEDEIIDTEKVIYEIINDISNMKDPTYIDKIKISISINTDEIPSDILENYIKATSTWQKELSIFDISVDYSYSKYITFTINNIMKHTKEYIIFMSAFIMDIASQSIINREIYPMSLKNINNNLSNLLKMHKDKIFKEANYETIQEQFGKKLNGIIMQPIIDPEIDIDDIDYDAIIREVLPYKNEIDIGDRFMRIFVKILEDKTITGMKDDLLPYKTKWHTEYKPTNLDFSVHIDKDIFLEIMQDSILKHKFNDALKRLHDETLEFHLKHYDNNKLELDYLDNISVMIYNLYKNYENVFVR